MAYWRMSFRDKEYFPTFIGLPPNHDISFRPFTSPDYYGISQVPLKHWCLLVEIIEPIPWPLRPMWRVKDKDGKEFLVVCYFDRDVEIPKSWEKHCKPGSVMAIMYALSHVFADGQIGIRVEDVENIKMIPCSLNALLRIWMASGAHHPLPLKMFALPAGLRCSGCSVTKYCGQNCQLDDWRLRHKRECVAVQQILEWKKRDWTDLDEYWVN